MSRLRKTNALMASVQRRIHIALRRRSMRPGQVHYDARAEASATKYHDCAVKFFNSNFSSAPQGCDITPLGEPWKDVAPPDVPYLPVIFPPVETTIIIVDDGIIHVD